MKEIAQKSKKHSINLARPNHIDRIPSAALVKTAIACQPKPQPNFIHFSQYAHPRREREECKENARVRENDAQVTSNRHAKGNVLLKDQRKSHQSTHEDQMRRTQKKFKAIREDRPLKGKTEWVSVEEQGNLGCHENLNSQIFRPGLSRSGRSCNRTAQATQESVI